jgi:hypothetical protein
LRLRSYGMAATLTVAACSGSTGPHATSPIIIFGNHQSDTILGTLPEPLLIGVTIPRGQSPSGHQVQFASLPDTNRQLGYQIYFGPPNDHSYFPPNSPEWADSTNASGVASVTVRMGAQAGTALVLITVPDFGYVDTATFTVLPGGAFQLVASPADTTVFTGVSFTYHSHTVDRFGNPRNDSLTYTVNSGPVTMSGPKATAGAPGSATLTIVAPNAGLGANASVTVVPHGALAASTGTGIVMFQLDGTGMQTILQGTMAGDVKWDPTGTHLAFDGNASCSAGTAILSTTDLHGTTTVVANGSDFEGSGNYQDAYPSYSSDGTWIYYQQNEEAGGATGRVRRVHIDGTGDTLISGPLSYYPTPSPDNSWIAYVIAGATTTSLRTLNLHTAAIDSIQSSVWSPEWSPTGNAIAYLTPFGCTGQIALVAPDGSGNRVLTSAVYHAGFDWSPDGQWIVATNTTTGLFDLINATTGQTIPLPYSTGLASPAWQPGSSPSTNRVRNKLGHK